MMMFPSFRWLYWFEATALSLATCIGIIALVFYWSRYWIHLNFITIIWIVLSLMPYLIHGLVASRLARRSKNRSAIVAALLGAIILFVVSALFYLPFLNEYTIFYLRWMLGIGAPVLMIISAMTGLMTWFLSRRQGASNG
jgi:hypothetical protein